MNRDDPPEHDPVKMVIVMRNDLNMRKGKMVAQGGHAACQLFIDLLTLGRPLGTINLEWIATGTKKICVRAESGDELLELENAALLAKLYCHLVTDSGLTEFDGPTRTCLAIGPDRASKIDPITGHLKLL